MFSFRTAFDDYVINLDIFEYETIEGSLRFVKNDSNMIIIDEIYVKKEFRQRGILKIFLEHVTNYMIKNKNKQFMIQSVISKILYDYLIRYEKNGCKFMLTKSGFLLKVTSN